MKSEKNLSQLMHELEQFVDKLEHDDVSLEDSFDLYKQGIEVARKCYEKLRRVENDVRLVTENGMDICEDAFSPQNQDEQGNGRKRKTRQQKSVHTEAESEENDEDISFPGLFGSETARD